MYHIQLIEHLVYKQQFKFYSNYISYFNELLVYR